MFKRLVQVGQTFESIASIAKKLQTFRMHSKQTFKVWPWAPHVARICYPHVSKACKPLAKHRGKFTTSSLWPNIGKCIFFLTLGVPLCLCRPRGGAWAWDPISTSAFPCVRTCVWIGICSIGFRWQPLTSMPVAVGILTARWCRLKVIIWSSVLTACGPCRTRRRYLGVLRAHSLVLHAWP